MIGNARLAYGLDVGNVFPVWHGVAAEIHGTRADGHLCQRHQILAVRAQVSYIMINRVLIPGNAPVQRIALGSGRDSDTIIDTSLNFGGLFVIVPGYELKGR